MCDKLINAVFLVTKDMKIDFDQVVFEEKVRKIIAEEELKSSKIKSPPVPRTYTLSFLQKFSEKKTDEDNSQELFESNAEKYKPAQVINTNKFNHKQYANITGSSSTFKRSHHEVTSRPQNVTKAHSRGENAWTPGKDAKSCNESETLVKKVRSDLNKISPENEIVISERICGIVTEDIIPLIIPVIFDKAVWEKKYYGIYSRLCFKLHNQFPNIFRKSLVTHCQKEFEVQMDSVDDDDIGVVALRRLGSLLFIVELYKNTLINMQVIFVCISTLLKIKEGNSTIEYLNDYDICHSADVLIVTLPLIDNPKLVSKFSSFVEFLGNITKHQKISSRAQFKIEDLLELAVDRQ